MPDTTAIDELELQMMHRNADNAALEIATILESAVDCAACAETGCRLGMLTRTAAASMLKTLMTARALRQVIESCDDSERNSDGNVRGGNDHLGAAHNSPSRSAGNGRLAN